MLGKGIMKLTGYAIAGAIALVAGAELLSSVVSVVFAFRLGNPSPLIGVVLITVGLLLVVNRISTESPLRLILNILSYAASGYLAVVVFVIVLPYGLIFSGIAAGLVAGICSFIKEPDVLTGYIRTVITQIEFSSSSNELSKRFISLGDGESFSMNVFQHPLLLETADGYHILEHYADAVCSIGYADREAHQNENWKGDQ